MSQDNTEINRIKKVYEKREKTVPTDRYSLFNFGNRFIVQRRDWEILNIIKTRGKSLKDMRILDVGCGAGGELRNFIRYGALPENLHGIDLLPDRIELAKRLSPNINFICNDASNLPYDNESFDIVMQFTVFTSILDKDMKLKIASEMLRVLKPDGIIIWYDYFVDNPKNHDVKGIKKKEIYKLFPNCDIHLKRITLTPPIARLVAPYSYLACYLLEKLKIFNTHYLGTIKKRTKSQP